MPDPRPTALDVLLDEDLGFDPTTAEGLSNHLPMALVALERLGASDGTLQRFFEGYARRLVPRAPAGATLTAGDWRRAIGTGRRFADLCGYFERAVADAGVDDTVSAHLPALLPGVGSAAFHGVIRLAYALDSGGPRRVAAGLAYLADQFRPLGAPTGAPARSADPRDLLADLRNDGRLRAVELSGWNIGTRMGAVAASPAFADVIDRLAVDGATGGALADAALLVYASTGDFTALHMVTGLHALRRLEPYAGEGPVLLRYGWQALAAAYLTIGAPPLLDDEDRAEMDATAPAWDRIVAAALGSSDEHVIKFAYSCREQDAVFPRATYRAVAARKARVAPEL